MGERKREYREGADVGECEKGIGREGEGEVGKRGRERERERERRGGAQDLRFIQFFQYGTI